MAARRVAAMTAAAMLVLALPASGQYFGRNTVRYDRFAFQVLKTEHFDVFHYPEEAAAVASAARMAERWYARLSQALGHEFSARQPIVLYASHAHFAQNTIVPGVGEGVGGVTEHLKGRVVMPFAVGLGETDHVLGHELVHAFQRDILRVRKRSIGLLPLWFVEGMAEYLTVGRLDTNTAIWLRDAAAHERLPSIDRLDDPRFFPYRYGHALWAYLAERFGENVVARALASTAPGGAPGRLAAATGVDVATLSADWHRAMQALASPAAAPVDGPEARRGVLRSSTPVISAGRHGGRLNLSPALSPDGTELVFLSERDGYAIDVFLADARTGAVTRRLVQMAADPRYDSLQVIGSAGAWAAAGRRFAIAVLRDGEAVLSVLDVDAGTIVREYVLDAVDAAHSPTWSPDGARIAFAGMRGGLSDLFVLDLATGGVEPLTDDAFADVRPAWSPDGRTIAFSTDRFTSSLETLRFGPLRLAALDLASRRVRALPAVPGDRNIDAQWAHDGRSLYFVADARQRSDVYRIALGAGTVYRVTALAHDVSGVTASSPALSVAAAAPRLAFTAYRRGGYEVHVVDARDGSPLPDGPVTARPSAAEGGGALQPAAVGLVDGGDFDVEPYRRGLALSGIGQPYLSMGGGSMGGFLRAGMSFSFGDLLDQHALRAAVQVGKTLPDLGLRVAYLSRASRWTWGVVGEQSGAVLGVNRRVAQPSADGAQLAVQDLRLTRIHRRLTGVATYPFSRARRLEVSGGLHAATYDQRVTTSLFAAGSGALVDRSVARGAPARALMLVETGAALVHDSAAYGPAGPVMGTRYRVGVSPTVGELRFVTAVADYRRYLMPWRPFTIAWRVRHFARVGPDASDSRLSPLVFDLRDTVRGYPRSTLGARLCGAAADAGCTVAALFGTRHVFSSNLELRAPLIGMFSRTPRYGPLPLEGFAFADTAWLWSRVADVSPLQAIGLQSAGAGVRVAAPGFTFEVAAARRFGRGGWGLALNLRPGF